MTIVMQQTKTHQFTTEKSLMPYITVVQENSATIDLYYEDLGTEADTANFALIHISVVMLWSGNPVRSGVY
jgi:hypothetical protein